jgi:hypothetical protein
MTTYIRTLLSFFLLASAGFCEERISSRSEAAAAPNSSPVLHPSAACEGRECLPGSNLWQSEGMRAERKRFHGSVIAYGVGTGADAWSSWRQPEANAFLRDGSGRFSTKGAVIKAGVFAGSAVAEYAILRKYSPKWLVRTFTVMNFALGSEYSAIAIHNRIQINRHSQSLR